MFDYYVPKNPDIYACFKDWKLSFDNCKDVWEKRCQYVANQFGSKSYKLKCFLTPRFKFDSAPEGWKRNPDGLYTPPQDIVARYFGFLPIPENFTDLCHQSGLPSLENTGLQYWLIWSPFGRLILSIPGESIRSEKGKTFSEQEIKFFYDNFDPVSEARYKFWIAKEFLELSGEKAD